jgi:hypothetical protein
VNATGRRSPLAGLPGMAAQATACLALVLLAVAPAGAATAAGAVGGVTLSAAAGPPPARPPATPSGMPADVEPLAGYVGQISCDPGAKPGTLALGRLLTTTYPGTSSGSFRPCGAGLGTSEHYDGRALDWMNTLRDPKQAAQATAVLGWLLGKDSTGHYYAVARRLGVMYLIWNNRIWNAYDPAGGWQPYSSCAAHPDRGWDTTCHRDHIHISLSWNGAMGRTSFWTRTVAAATDYGPCRPADLNWAPRYRAPNPRRCPSYPPVRPPARASATLVALTTYSGAELRTGSVGPAVTAVQRALAVPAGTYGTGTATAVSVFQRRHGLRGTGQMDAGTWRALLRALAPR